MIKSGRRDPAMHFTHYIKYNIYFSFLPSLVSNTSTPQKATWQVLIKSFRAPFRSSRSHTRISGCTSQRRLEGVSGGLL